MGHDCAKHLPLRLQWQLARESLSLPSCHAAASCLARLERPHADEFADKVIHGPASAVLFMREFGVENEAVLDAVAYHSVGSVDMGPMAKVLYIADKLEPGREWANDEARDACRSKSLDELLAFSVASTIAWLSAEGRGIAESTLDLYNALKARTAQR